MKNSNIKILRYPTEDDWQRCKNLAINTMGRKYVGGEVTKQWKMKILKANHSPIRTLMFTIEMQVPYYISVHFVRHKHGVEHFVQSQRNDRQNNYDRATAPQNEIVSHIMDINAAALINMAGMRLCGQAYRDTQVVMAEVVAEVLKVSPEFKYVLLPKCLQHDGYCNEFKPCGVNNIKVANG